MTSTEALAYIAGFFDGEGSIYFGNSNGCTYTFLQFVNTDKRVIQWIKNTLGIRTKIVLDKPHRYSKKNSWKLFVNSQRDVDRVAKLLLPYLIVKARLVRQHLSFLQKKRSNQASQKTHKMYWCRR